MRYDLVIFDNDGVLVDSEPMSNRLLAAYLTELGHPTSYEDQCATGPDQASPLWHRMFYRCSVGGGLRICRILARRCNHQGIDVSSILRLKFAQPRQGRRVDTYVWIRTVRPTAELIKLTVGLRRVREAFHS